MEVKTKKCDKKIIFYLFFKDIKFLILHSYLELNMVMILFYQVEALLITQNPQKQFFLD
mgnify:CR=1 FL=1